MSRKDKSNDAFGEMVEQARAKAERARLEQLERTRERMRRTSAERNETARKRAMRGPDGGGRRAGTIGPAPDGNAGEVLRGGMRAVRSGLSTLFSVGALVAIMAYVLGWVGRDSGPSTPVTVERVREVVRIEERKPGPPRIAIPTPPGVDTQSYSPVEAVIKKQPRYPVERVTRPVSGDVVVQFDVTPHGANENITVVEAPHPALGEAGADALAFWRFRPAYEGNRSLRTDGVRVTFAMAPTAAERERIEARKEADTTTDPGPDYSIEMPERPPRLEIEVGPNGLPRIRTEDAPDTVADTIPETGSDTPPDRIIPPRPVLPAIPRPVPPPPGMPGGTAETNADIRKPELITRTPPRYPTERLLVPVSGTVVAEYTVSDSGRVEDIRIVKTPHPALSEAVEEAMATWLFTPALKDARPIAMSNQRITIYFEAPDGR